MITTKSAGGVVLNAQHQIVLVSQHGTSWSLPKGHIEEGEDELTAAKREIREETGITQLELLKKLGSYTRYRIGKDGSEDTSEQKTITLFLFRTAETELKPIDPENPEAKWIEKEEVVGLLTHEADKTFFLKNKATFIGY